MSVVRWGVIGTLLLVLVLGSGCTGILMASHPTYEGRRVVNVHQEALSLGPRSHMAARILPSRVSDRGLAMTPESRWYCRQAYRVRDESPIRSQSRRGAHSGWHYGLGGAFDAAAIAGLGLSGLSGDTPNAGVAVADMPALRPVEVR